MGTVYTIEEQIKEREAELKKLRIDLEEARKEDPDHALARELHRLICGWNHTDGCDWYWEMKDNKDDWNGRTHAVYLGKALKFRGMCNQKNITVEDALSSCRMVKNL